MSTLPGGRSYDSPFTPETPAVSISASLVCSSNSAIGIRYRFAHADWLSTLDARGGGSSG